MIAVSQRGRGFERLSKLGHLQIYNVPFPSSRLTFCWKKCLKPLYICVFM